jgi:6-pyruvoyltetrahydropterin/6-carboxytetrahydropterin synthase
MAHALENHDGLCRSIHGHSYLFWVTILGQPVPDKTASECGMVVDFSKIKQWVNKAVTTKFDHALVLRKGSEYRGVIDISNDNMRVVFVDFQPTCETLLIHFKPEIKKQLPENLELFALKLSETATSFAEWYKNDQK